MRYQVRFVASDALPSGVEWAFARTLGQTYLFVSQGSIDPCTGRCDALTRAWEAWQKSEAHATRRGLRQFAVAI